MKFTEQQLRDMDMMQDLSANSFKIELAQKILGAVLHPDLNTPLKEAMRSLEFARRENHKMLNRTMDILFE